MHGPLDMGYQPKSDVPSFSDANWINITPEEKRKLTELKLSIWPRKCNSSKKSIWFKYAYRVRWFARLNDYGIQHSDRWYTKSEYIKLRLLG
jgi:hypothetical protein